jgi:hypothetical protein
VPKDSFFSLISGLLYAKKEALPIAFTRR